MIAAQVVEELFLDYKQSSTTLPAARLSVDDRKNLGRAIGGFANSEGGVIVWGVDCRHTTHGDVPTKAVPIAQPLALKTLFDSALGGLTLPAHSGVENLDLLNSQRTDGFVVTHVPAGLHVPYQTLFPKHEYYIRAGSTFQPTPHGVLAGLFGRTPQPNVVPTVRFQAAQFQGGRFQIDFEVATINNGRGFAEGIFCLVETKLPSGLKVLILGEVEAWRAKNDNNECWTIMIDKRMLPPGSQLSAFNVQLRMEEHVTFDHVQTISCGSKGGPGGALTIALPREVLNDAFDHYRHQYPDPVSRREGDKLWERRIKECFP
jgi:hypothetical protein